MYDLTNQAHHEGGKRCLYIKSKWKMDDLTDVNVIKEAKQIRGVHMDCWQEAHIFRHCGCHRRANHESEN